MGGSKRMVTLNGREKRVERFEEDALREVLAIERQAQGILNDAEAEAKKISAAAQQRIEEIKAEAEKQGQEQAGIALRESLAELEAQTHTIQKEAERAAEEWVQAAQPRLDEAVAYVLGVVTLRETG
jgi:vacuolar-type H+-ATPase subunit H